ncbi:ABC transporter [Tissierella sp. P1]|uniref:siderophore ABC transporter substrate-binding protein n=1 Tax=unclassified Tissierella TaxID=2638726 RepID=UPI000BA16F48|nr:siderophore ABC transporter substrate-binding protein [Tissierella sp. P1]MDU5083172.1 siderophore ABC transporter substrate-binding protein [Bacillota bacterium]OZV10732.1 ABC transporter [Tissierella sp. P1]
MKKTKSLLILVLVIVAALTLTACNSKKTPEDIVVDSQNEENVQTPNENAEEPSTITITHHLGETVVNKKPEKVIVFDYATLDSLDKLGVEIIGLPKSNIPTFLEKFNDEKYEDVGTLFEPNFEKIFELEPDVIFVSGRQAEVYDELAKIAPTVFLNIDGANYMKSFTDNVKLLGEIFGKEDLVEKELASINEAVQALNKAVTEDEKNALIVMANDGAISVYGEGSRFGIIHGDFGFIPIDKNIPADNHGDKVTFEYILEKDPQYILIIDRAATTGGSTSAEQIFDNDIIKQTQAYKNDKIIYLSSQVWYVASGGLTGTMTMIEDIQSGL